MIEIPIKAYVRFPTWGEIKAPVVIFDETPQRYKVEAQEDWIDGRAQKGDLKMVPKNLVIFDDKEN